MHKRWQGHILADLIETSNNKIQIIAEIGVWKSHTVKRILKRCHNIVSQYWAVDPWQLYDSGKARRLLPEGWDGFYLHACKLMYWFPKLRVIRMTSVEAAKLFPERYFDLVFLDADHSYEAVLEDIRAWRPLVKTDGLLTGHDYGEKPGVREAVDEFFGGDIELLPEAVWMKKI